MPCKFMSTTFILIYQVSYYLQLVESINVHAFVWYTSVFVGCGVIHAFWSVIGTEQLEAK